MTGSRSVSTHLRDRRRAGANRIGYSPEEDEAHRLAADWMSEAGLEVEVDPDGNLIGRLAGTDTSLPEVWSGSHLDSVPQGGRYDGPLGVSGRSRPWSGSAAGGGRSPSSHSGRRSEAASAARRVWSAAASRARISSSITSKARGSPWPVLRSRS